MLHAYILIEELLVITKHNLVYDLKDLEKVLQKLTEVRLMVTMVNSLFGCTETD